MIIAPAMSLRTEWGSVVKSAKNLNATPGKSILGLVGLTCLSIPCLSPTCPYGSLAPSPHAADQSWLSWLSWSVGLHPIVQGGFVVGLADWTLRIAFPSWFHNCSIWVRSGLHAGHSYPRYLPGLQVISGDDPGSMRANIKWRPMSLNQTMKLWNLGNDSMFRLSAFMSFILCMEITNKWLIAPLYRANRWKLYLALFTIDPALFSDS